MAQKAWQLLALFFVLDCVLFGISVALFVTVSFSAYFDRWVALSAIEFLMAGPIPFGIAGIAIFLAEFWRRMRCGNSGDT